jgi:hypothetical protein
MIDRVIDLSILLMGTVIGIVLISIIDRLLSILVMGIEYVLASGKRLRHAICRRLKARRNNHGSRTR